MAKTFEIVKPVKQGVQEPESVNNQEVQEQLTFGEVLVKIFSLEDISEGDYRDIVDALAELVVSEKPELIEAFYTQLSAYKNMLGCESIVMTSRVIDKEIEVLDDLMLLTNDLQDGVEGLKVNKRNEEGYVLFGGFAPTEMCTYPVVSLAKFASLLLRLSTRYRYDLLKSIVDSEITIFHKDDVVKSKIVD